MCQLSDEPRRHECWRLRASVSLWQLTRTTSVEAYVLEVDWLRMDPAPGRRNPVGKLARLDDAAGHHRLDERVISGARHPLVAMRVPSLFRQHLPFRADVM